MNDRADGYARMKSEELFKDVPALIEWDIREKVERAIAQGVRYGIALGPSREPAMQGEEEIER